MQINLGVGGFASPVEVVFGGFVLASWGRIWARGDSLLVFIRVLFLVRLVPTL